MQTKTFSQRLNGDGKRPDISVELSRRTDEIIVTVGPHGGPYQTVYLNPMQAEFIGASFVQMANEQNNY